MATAQAIFVYVAAFILLYSTSAVTATFNRRILHHPLFPLDSPAPTQPPNSSAHPPTQTKSNATNHHSPPPASAHPLSSTIAGGGGAAPSAATTTANPDNPFFPTYPSLSPPPPSPAASSSSAGEGSLPTFPANISSLVVPHSRSSSSSHSARSPKLIAVTVVLCLVAVSLFASFFLLRRHRNRRDRSPLRHVFKQPSPPSTEETTHSDNAVLYPPYSATSDGRPPKLPVRAGVSTTSSEFLYLGTMAASNSTEFEPLHHDNQIESPEIRPLPPLRPLHKHNRPRNSDSDATDSDEFYSPANSSGRIENFRSSSTRRVEALARIEGFQNESKISKFTSYEDSTSSSPGNSARSGPSVLVNSASDSSNSCSPEYIMRPPPIIHRVPPPPPPPPPPATARRASSEPPTLPQPSRSVMGFKSGEQQPNSQAQTWNRDGNERNDEIRKPKLKGLHWDKVRASSDRVTVWDQLEAGSFALNEEMMETLFTANTTTMGAKDHPRRPTMNQEYRVLDPKKSQNIAILLRALNVTVEEVCDSLLEGNADMLGTELLESLLKMTPTQEEERKLREYKDELPQKLGPAEKFLKAVLDIPFAFKRVDAMLYIANFDSELEYLKRSFQALEAACDELRSSKMFMKLLEAVLKTGNRMNVGTNRGDAEAFKLDTLLKLVDVKGTDGKTTLLHFVVQEIIKAQGTRLSLQDDVEAKKRGLQIVSGLCGELTNVKKAAAMDSDVLANDVQRLVTGISRVHEVAGLSEERFVDSMSVFLKKAGGEIGVIQALENDSLLKVKELTEYFHGNSAKEEAHPLRIFMVVRDFLSILDKVCKEVAKVNERTIISSNRSFVMPVNPNLPQLFPDHSNGERREEEGDSSL